MYQSSARKNFLDILLDPTAIAILASLALHTIIGAGLPFFTRPDSAGIKSGPTTVKVVELTPSELQRIPQAPPVPTPQAVPPPTQRAPSPSPVAPPRATKFSTAPQTIPFSPLRPSDGTLFQPPAAKPKKAASPKRPLNPLFDPNAIFNSPTKAPKPQTKKGVTTKPSPSTSSPVVTKPATKAPTKAPKKLVTPQPNTETDDDGGSNPPAQTPPANNSNNRPAQQPAGTNPTANTNPSNSTPTTPTEPANTSGDSGGGGGFYGRYTQEALKRLIDYKQNIPGLVVYQPAVLKVDYPAKAACTSAKQSPYIVYMVAFDKVAEIAPDDITSERLTQTVDKSAIYGDKGNAQLFRYAAFKATEASTTADLNRPAADKGKRVLYQYRVEFNPASCKK